MKKPRCKCLACKGKTIEFSRLRLLKNLEWMLGKGLITQKDFIDGMRGFDEYHEGKEN